MKSASISWTKKFRNMLIPMFVLLLMVVPTSTGLNIGQRDFNSPDYVAILNRSFEEWNTNTSPKNWNVISGVARRDITSFRGSWSMNQYAISGVSQVQQKLSSYTVASVKGKTLSFSAYTSSYYSSPTDLVMVKIKAYYKTYWHTYPITNIKELTSGWVNPGAVGQWKEVTAKGYIPSTTFKIEVSLNSKDPNNGYHTVYFDYATLSILSTITKNNQHGSASMGIMIYQSQSVPGGYRQINFATSIAYDTYTSVTGYFMESVVLKIELLPTKTSFFRTKTTQDGTLVIYGSGQGNDINKEMHSVGQDSNIELGMLIAKVVVGTAFKVAATATIGPEAGAVVGFATNLGFAYLKEKSNAFDGSATGGYDYYTKAVWTNAFYYSETIPPVTRDGFVLNYYTWTFKEGHTDYRLKISGTVNFGEPVRRVPGTGADPYYDSRVVSTLSFVQYIDV